MYKNSRIPSIAITNRHLVEGDFITQIRKVAKRNPESIVLREKDLSEEAYEVLAKEVLSIGNEFGIPIFLHTYVEVTKRLGSTNIHVPFRILQNMTKEEKVFYQQIGVSVHSLEEAQEAQRQGATRVIVGHIFETSCKPNLPARGISFLKKVCQSVTIPVYAIGGITEENAKECMKVGAAGVCMMSGFMNC